MQDLKKNLPPMTFFKKLLEDNSCKLHHGKVINQKNQATRDPTQE